MLIRRTVQTPAVTAAERDRYRRNLDSQQAECSPDQFVQQGNVVCEKLKSKTNPASALLRAGLDPQKLVDIAQAHDKSRVVFADYFQDHNPPQVTSLGALLATAPPIEPDHGDHVLRTFLDQFRKLPAEQLNAVKDRIEIARVPMIEDNGVADVVQALTKVIALAQQPGNNVVAINLCSDYHDMSLGEMNQLLPGQQQLASYGDFDLGHKAVALAAFPSVSDAVSNSWFGGADVAPENAPKQVRQLGLLVQQLGEVAQHKAVLIASGNGGYVQPLALAPHAVIVGVSGEHSLETVMPDTYAREEGDYSSFSTPVVTAAVALLIAQAPGLE